MPSVLSASVRLAGARVIEGKTAAITYRVGDYDAELLVAKADGLPRDSKHQFIGSTTYKGRSVFAWTMRGQLYTVACTAPVEKQMACVLCHGDGRRMPVVVN